MTYRMGEMTWPEFAARKDKPVIVPIGSTEQHSQHLPMCVDALLAEHLATDLAEAVDGTVMPTIVVEAIDLVTRETSGKATIIETNWWDPLPQDVVDQVFDGLTFPGWALEHAAVTETSLMLHYAPELVHMDRMTYRDVVEPKPYVRYPVRDGDVPAYGGLADPSGSSAERGRLIAESCVTAVADICRHEFGI